VAAEFMGNSKQTGAVFSGICAFIRLAADEIVERTVAENSFIHELW